MLSPLKRDLEAECLEQTGGRIWAVVEDVELQMFMRREVIASKVHFKD